MAEVVDDLEDLFENAPCGYLAAGADGRITKVNRTFSEWIGRDKAEMVGRRFSDFLNIAGKIFYETHFAPLLRMQGFFNEVALDLVRPDGSILPALVNAVERRDEAGNLRFFRITVFNASDRRRYERELLEARRASETANAALMELNRTLEERIAEAVDGRLKSEATLHQAQKMEAVGQLTGGIAHDFNNMLAIIFSSLSLLERRLAKGEDVSRYIASAQDGANRAADLTKRLLAFSRQQTLAPQAIDANQMVADMSELLRRTLGETIQFGTVLADSLWPVFADRNLLESAILNLAINARDAMPDGGRLTIETANCNLAGTDAHEQAVEPGEYVVVAVTDSGTGMTPEVMANAFDPFFTTKSAGMGTGLGLSQVFGFVKQSHGFIKICSDVGHGTTIRIHLPRHHGVVHAKRLEVEQNGAPLPGREIVLLVEDDEQVLSLTGQALRDLGYGVIEARGGNEALDALAAHPEINLLLTDVVMPGMNGCRLAEQALGRHPSLKILYTTGYVPKSVVQGGRLDPGTKILQKPVTLKQLAATVRAVLDHDE